MRIKVVKAKACSKQQKMLIQGLAILIALAITGIFIAALGHNPVSVYLSMIEGCFGTMHRFRETIIKIVPLLITALGIAVAFKMKFWNIGAEGQILMGAVGATYIALNFNHLPKPLVIILMMGLAIICGGLWALIPGILKARYSASESIITLMMNYVALKIVMYLQYSAWKDPKANGFPKIAMFESSAVLPKVAGIHIGWIFAIVLAVVVYIFLNYTKKGYEITVLGESENTARYAGMNVAKIVIMSTFISGALAGLVGMIQASAVSTTLNVNVAGGVGYTAIIVAWLGGLSAPWICVVATLFAVLVQGGSYIQTAFQIPQSAADIIQATILFCVLGSQFFTQYRFMLETKKNEVTSNKQVEGGK